MPFFKIVNYIFNWEFNIKLKITSTEMHSVTCETPTWKSLLVHYHRWPVGGVSGEIPIKMHQVL